jgi:hypothetical protein
MKCRVVGVDYTPDLTLDDLQSKVMKRSDDDYVVAVVHALSEMSPKDSLSDFFNETVFDYRDLAFRGAPDAYVFGHYHKDQGIVDHQGVKFVNLGSISRGALTFENLERRPKSSLITINSQGISIEEILIPSEDPADIFDLELKKKIDRERRSLDDFIEHLKEDSGTSGFSISESMKLLPSDVRDLAKEIIEAAEAGVLD